MALSEFLRTHLICPLSRAPLVEDGSRLVSTDAATRRAYPVEDGIPRILADVAVTLTPSEWEAVMAANGLAGAVKASDPSPAPEAPPEFPVMPVPEAPMVPPAEIPVPSPAEIPVTPVPEAPAPGPAEVPVPGDFEAGHAEVQAAPKRRGRPPKEKPVEEEAAVSDGVPKRKRGRPRKDASSAEPEAPETARSRPSSNEAESGE